MVLTKPVMGDNVISDDTITDNIVSIVDKSWEKLRPFLVETKMTDTGIFRELIMYPEAACREALINAIAHRNYALEGQGIQINVFDDRMEFFSPGGLLSTLKIDDLSELKGVHESRNAFIAKVLRQIGYVRELGEGIRRMFLLMQDAELVPPELHSNNDSFTVTLKYKSVFEEDDQKWLDGYNLLDLTKEERILALLGKAGNPLSPQQVYDRLNLVDWDVYRVIIEQAQTKGLIHNTFTEAQKKSYARRNLISQREVPRNVIYQPNECENCLLDLFSSVYINGVVDVVNTPYISKILYSLKEDNIYKTNNARISRLLGLIGFIDEHKKPLPRMSLVWKEKATSVSDITVPEPVIKSDKPVTFKTKLGERVEERRDKNIYVSNLDYDISEETLRELFSQYGDVQRVRIPKSLYTGRGRGFGFVMMASHLEAESSLNGLNGTDFQGRIISTDWDYPKPRVDTLAK